MNSSMQSTRFLFALFILNAPFAYAAPKYLIKLKPSVNTLAAYSHLQWMGAQVVDEIPELGIVLTDTKVQPSFVEYIEENAVWTTQTTPNDAQLDKMTAQLRAKLPEAWTKATGSRTVLVGVVDTGVDGTHPDLAANMYVNQNEIAGDGIDNDQNGFVDDVRGWNFAANTANAMDDNKHGTHVAGILGAVGNNAIGIAGVNWEVSIMPIKFLTANGSGTTDGAVKGIIYAANQGAKILNNSWGGGAASQALEDAIRYAAEKGVLFVAAAGNDSSNNDSKPKYPASYPVSNILTVASTENYGKLSKFSNFGLTGVHVAAPGSNVYSTVPGGKYASLSGTSMATPVVSGIAALIASQRPELGPVALRNAVMQAIQTYPDYASRIATGGEVDASKALEQLDAGFQVWPSRVAVKAGKTFDVTAYRAPASIVTWNTEHPDIATVNAQGQIHGVKEGETKLIAMSGGQTVRTEMLKVVGSTGGGKSPGSCSKVAGRKLTTAETASHVFGMLLPFFIGLGFQLRARRR